MYYMCTNKSVPYIYTYKFVNVRFRMTRHTKQAGLVRTKDRDCSTAKVGQPLLSLIERRIRVGFVLLATTISTQLLRIASRVEETSSCSILTPKRPILNRMWSPSVHLFHPIFIFKN